MTRIAAKAKNATRAALTSGALDSSLRIRRSRNDFCSAKAASASPARTPVLLPTWKRRSP